MSEYYAESFRKVRNKSLKAWNILCTKGKSWKWVVHWNYWKEEVSNFKDPVAVLNVFFCAVFHCTLPTCFSITVLCRILPNPVLFDT